MRPRIRSIEKSESARNQTDLEIRPQNRTPGEVATVVREGQGGGLPCTEVCGVINVIDHLSRRVLIHPHILRAIRAGRVALEDGGCAVRHHVEARVPPVVVLGPAEVLPSQPSRRIRAQPATETGRGGKAAKDFLCKSNAGLAAHAQMRVKASVGWQVVRRHVAEVALTHHVSLVVRLL